MYTGTSKQLAMLIEGESLLNDGAAIVLFTVFQKILSPKDYMGGILHYLFPIRFLYKFCINLKVLISYLKPRLGINCFNFFHLG